MRLDPLRRKLLLSALALTLAGALAAAPRVERRARPPRFTAAQQGVFFADASRELVGQRPASLAAPAGPTGAPSPAEGPQDTRTGAPPGAPPADSPKGGFAWSGLIDADAVETEVKRQAGVLKQHTASATGFKGGGYRACRDAMSVLAVMFTVAAEHDQNARWRDAGRDAAGALARAAANCKVGTDGSFREASQRALDLEELLRGGRPTFPAADPDAAWGALADRGPLMRRLEQAHQEGIAPLLAGARQFARGAEAVRHEAQVLAALMEAQTRPGFEDAEDEGYTGMARELIEAAEEIARAAGADDPAAAYDAARAAQGRATRACADCHDSYRG